MQNIRTVDDLANTIQYLENIQQYDLGLLKEQFLQTYENLKPLNLVKNTIQDLAEDPDVKTDLLNSTIQMAAGYFTKKIVVGESQSAGKKILGTLVQMGITKIISNVVNKSKSSAEPTLNGNES